METKEVMRTRLVGKYFVQMHLENHNPHNDGIEFKNLFEAVKYVNGLTYADCKNELNLTDNDVRGQGGFDVNILLHEDEFGDDCKSESGFYPVIYSTTITEETNNNINTGV